MKDNEMKDELMRNGIHAQADLRLILVVCSSFIYSSFIAFPTLAANEEALATAQPQYLFQLSYTDAQEAISKALVEKGAGTHIAATLTRNNGGSVFSYKQPISVEIRSLQFDKRTAHWSASLVCLSEGEVVTAIPAEGRFEEMVSAPVLKRGMHNGDVISEDDLEMRDFPLAHTPADTVSDTAALVGKSPVRAISAGRPVRNNEIANPTLIKKNTLVQMRYVSPGMEITASAQALSDGAKGDVISVRNVDSHKILRAIVENENTVSIVAPGTETSQLTGATHAAN